MEYLNFILEYSLSYNTSAILPLTNLVKQLFVAMGEAFMSRVKPIDTLWICRSTSLGASQT